MKNYSRHEYLEQFRDDVAKNYRLEKALNRAWKNRDFEINLFWKRANHFWIFLAFSYSGFFYIFQNLQKNLYHAYFLVMSSALCCISSAIWAGVLDGSKAWQENWEGHIDILEDFVEGPIYKLIIGKNKNSFSVTKLNIALAYVSMALSSLLFYISINNSIIPRGLTITFFLDLVNVIILIFFNTKTSPKSKYSYITMRQHLIRRL